jgi:hypothetical protein
MALGGIAGRFALARASLTHEVRYPAGERSLEIGWIGATEWQLAEQSARFWMLGSKYIYFRNL